MTTIITNGFNPTKTALAVANAVFREFGFVKRNHSYFDVERNQHVFDSKTIVVNTLRKMHDEQFNSDIVTASAVLDEDYAAAEMLCTFFSEKTVMAKLSGQMSDFDQILSLIVHKDTIDTGRDMSILVSLPNSYVIEQRRIAMDELFLNNRSVGSFVGKVKERLKLTVDVKDVKLIPKHNSYLVTMMTDDNQIVKFFLKDTDADLSERIRDSRITFVGTVRKQEVSEYTKCHETVFNRVKVIDN